MADPKIGARFAFHTRSQDGTGKIEAINSEHRGTWYTLRRPKTEGGGTVTVRAAQLRKVGTPAPSFVR